MDFWMINACIFLIYSCVCLMYKKEKTFLVLAFFHLTLITALRGSRVGTDTYNYCRIYNKIASGSFRGSTLIPKGNILHYYYKIISFIINKENGYMISTSIPTMLAFYMLIKRYVKNYYLGVYFFVASYIYFFSMNAGRQMLAVAATILSFALWNDKKRVASLIMYFVAVQIHNSSIIFGVFFLISFIQWNAATFLLFAVISFIACRSITMFINLFIKLFPRYRWIIRHSYIYDLSSGGRLSFLYGSICFFSILMMFYWILQSEGRMIIELNKDIPILPKNKLKRKEIQFYYMIMAMLVVSGSLYILYPTVILFTRMSYYLFVYFLILLSDSIEQMTLFKKTTIFLVYAAFFVTMVYQLYGGYSGVLHYKFYGLGI